MTAKSKGETMHSTYARGQPFISGETVTGGCFECERCGHRLELEGGRVVNLPVCPRCRKDRWKPA